jgi:trigger factor
MFDLSRLFGGRGEGAARSSGVIMQVSVENLSKLERKLTISVPSERLDTTVRARLRELGQNVRLKGFRPGKVPAKVIEQRYGRQVRSEALGELIRQSFAEAVQQEKLRPAVAPSIETSGDPEDGAIRYTATFEVMPEIGKIDVSGLHIVKPTASVADTDIDTMIDTLRLQRRSWNPVERAAQAGDLVMFESSATNDNGRIPAEGVERAGTILGSNALFAEFEQALIGITAGEERSFTLAVPADYRVPALAGKQTVFNVKAARVSEASMPAVDEAFIRSFGIEGGDLNQFRTEVRANLERELKGVLMGRLKADVVEKLVAAHAEIEFPTRMVEAEARGLARQAEQQAKSQGQKDAKISHEGFLPVAKKRVAAAMLLGELAHQNNIRLDGARVSEMLSTIASTYEEPQQVIDLYRNDPQLMQGLQSRVIEDQVIDWIAEHSDLATQQLSFAEVMRTGQGG